MISVSKTITLVLIENIINYSRHRLNTKETNILHYFHCKCENKRCNMALTPHEYAEMRYN